MDEDIMNALRDLLNCSHCDQEEINRRMQIACRMMAKKSLETTQKKALKEYIAVLEEYFENTRGAILLPKTYEDSSSLENLRVKVNFVAGFCARHISEYSEVAQKTVQDLKDKGL